MKNNLFLIVTHLQTVTNLMFTYMQVCFCNLFHYKTKFLFLQQHHTGKIILVMEVVCFSFSYFSKSTWFILLVLCISLYILEPLSQFPPKGLLGYVNLQIIAIFKIWTLFVNMLCAFLYIIFEFCLYKGPGHCHCNLRNFI
jgi:hypothetical protein